MAKRKPGLGKGLDALIGKPQQSHDSQYRQTAAEGLHDIAVEHLQRGQYQPRRHFDAEALQELAASIKQQGLLQPIVVRELAPKKFEIIAGERRWRAAQLAGLASIKAIVKQLSDEEAIALALIENLQREDLNPVEEALALQRLQKEFNYSQQQVADAVGKPRSTIANILRLTSLHADVLKYLERGDIETGHAKCVLALDRQQQLSAAKTIVSKGFTVRQAESLVRTILQGGEASLDKQKTPAVDPNIKRLENDLSDKLNAKVVLKQQANNKGSVTIHYNSLDELDGILKHIH